VIAAGLDYPAVALAGAAAAAIGLVAVWLSPRAAGQPRWTSSPRESADL